MSLLKIVYLIVNDESPLIPLLSKPSRCARDVAEGFQASGTPSGSLGAQHALARAKKLYSRRFDTSAVSGFLRKLLHREANGSSAHHVRCRSTSHLPCMFSLAQPWASYPAA